MVGPLVDRSDRADNFAGSGGWGTLSHKADQPVRPMLGRERLVVRLLGAAAGEEYGVLHQRHSKPGRHALARHPSRSLPRGSVQILWNRLDVVGAEE